MGKMELDLNLEGLSMQIVLGEKAERTLELQQRAGTNSQKESSTFL